MAAASFKQNSFTIEVEHQMRDSFKILEHMRKEQQLCDVTLVVKNIEIYAHKIVLASCSPYFYSMFTKADGVKQERIELDVNVQILLSMVNYMYTSKLTVSEDNIEEMLMVANMLLLHSVKDECCKILQLMIDSNNCLDIKTMAAAFGNSDLLLRTSAYIDAHFVDVVASEAFLHLTSNQMHELISKDTLKTPSEENVYECVVRWINHDTKGRRKYLRSLMGCIRLSLISKAYLKQHIVNDPFLRGDSYCKDLIINALLEDNTKTNTSKSRDFCENNALLAIGGVGSEAEKSMEFYDIAKKEWSEILEIPFSISLAGLGVVNQNMYIVGGERDGITTNAVSLYNIAANRWHEVVGMTTKRSRHGVAVLDNYIYAVGGSDGTNVLSSAEKFDLKMQKWIPIASMTSKRRDLGISVFKGALYAVAGCDGKSILNSIECYNPRTDTWKKLRNMEVPRNGVGVCTLDGKIYVIGGMLGWGYCSSTVHEYNPDADSWTNKKPLHIGRASAGVAVANEEIYVVGGQDHKGLISVEVYNKWNDSWTLLQEPMNVVRTGHAVAAVRMPA